jgi:hypothetical protein
MVLDRMRRLASFRGNLLGAAAVAVLAAGGLASSAQAIPIALSSVACPSGSQCVAVGRGQEGTFNPVSPSGSTTTPVTIDSGGSLTGVACPTGSEYCTAVDSGGQEVTFKPGSGALVASSPATIDGNGDLTGVACPSEEQCTAVDRYGYEVTFDPISGIAVSGSFERIDASGGIQSVACASEKQCTVVDFNGYELTFEPGSNREISLARFEVGDLTSVACPSEGECVAVDTEGHEVTFEPASPGEPPPTPITIDSATALTGVACPSVSQCTAVDASGHELTFEPALPGTPTPFAIDGTVALTSIACPAEKQCTAVDAHGHEVTFEPTSGKTNPSSTTIGAGPVPSAAKSSIVVVPDPTLLSGLGGSASLQATVTLEGEGGEPVPEDLVTLEVDGGFGSLREGIADDPQETDSEGKATFDFTCPAGYCAAGDLLTVTATDEDGPSLGPVTDPVGEIQFAGASYTGQTDTLEIQDLGGGATGTGEQPVTLTLNGFSVVPFGPCATSSTGSLPLAGELGACTFTVPEIPFPKGQSPPASIPAVVTVGTREFDVSFPLRPTPSVELLPTSGLERSAISINGTGFASGAPVKVDFTPHGAGTPSTSVECQTNDDGEIINTEPIGKPDSCDLTVPADSPVGKGAVSVEGYPTATAPFTVEPPTLVGIGIASNLPGNRGGAGGHLYLGETATLEIEGHYNTGTIKSLEVPAGAVSWSPEPQPSGAIELNMVNGHTIGLTAQELTKSTGAGVVKVTYEGFEAESQPIKVTHEPCKGCTFVNGALLNVQIHAQGGYTALPVGNFTANITQGVGGAPVFTLPPPCIPENGGCAGGGYPQLEESATATCAAPAEHECQLIAGEGTEGVATEIEDTVTLTGTAGYAPGDGELILEPGYSAASASGCTTTSLGGPGETTPVCHLRLGELTAPKTISFEVKPWPTVTVKVGGPESAGSADNEELNGTIVTITPTDGTPGQQTTCEVEHGQDTSNQQAACTRQFQPGVYEVSLASSIAVTGGEIYVTSADPQTIAIHPGEHVSVSFQTATEPELQPTLTGNAGGPEIPLGESALPCAGGAIASQPSPPRAGAPPTALTPRLNQPGSLVTITAPSGNRFCPGQRPVLGGAVVSSLDEATPAKLEFRVPAEASGGLALTSSSGQPGPDSAYQVDNFRYPWGFSIVNSDGDGSNGTYDRNVKITAQDLDSVFTGLGPAGSPEYEEAQTAAAEVLSGGLCYGFSLLSWELYGDAHGQHDPLAWTDSTGFTLTPGSEPYPLTEAPTGSHDLTHALLRGALSQFSPEAQSSWHAVNSSSGLQGQLDSAFARGEPAMLLMHFATGGHAVLAFNYQKPDPSTGEGLAVDVVDPNVPWSSARPASDYQMLQVHVRPDGSWTFDGTFFSSPDFASHVSGSAGSLYVVPEPVSPGALHPLPPPAGEPEETGTLIDPGAGARVDAISYTGAAGSAIPADVKPEEIFDEAPDDRLIVPAAHRDITVTLGGAPGAPTSSDITGQGFLDSAQLPPAARIETVQAKTGTLTVPLASTGTVLSVTRVVGGVQRTVKAHFNGNVRRPTIAVSASGGVTLTSTGGAGKVTLSLATYTSSGEAVLAHTQTLELRGHTRITRHTPKRKRHKTRKKRKR